MALQFQNIAINFQGLNKKVDDKSGVPGILLKLENAWQDKTGAYRKRYGHTIVDYSASDYVEGITSVAGYAGEKYFFGNNVAREYDNRLFPVSNWAVSENALSNCR